MEMLRDVLGTHKTRKKTEGKEKPKQEEMKSLGMC